jgi:hypothetical protein
MRNHAQFPIKDPHHEINTNISDQIRDEYEHDECQDHDIITRHGKMEYWDVSNISDFSNIFTNRRNPNIRNFNEDKAQIEAFPFFQFYLPVTNSGEGW